MKILMLATNYEAPVGGGGQKSLKVLVDGLIAQGHEVVVVALAYDEPEVTFSGNVKVYYLKTHNVFRPVDSKRRNAALRIMFHAIDRFNYLAAHDINKICLDEKPDLVHSHVITGLSVSIWKAVKDLEIPLIHTLRDQYLLCARSTLFKNGHQCLNQCADCKVFRFNYQKISRYVDGVIGISRFMLKAHLDRGYFPSAAVKKVIYNARERSALGLNNDLDNSEINSFAAVTFGFIGTLAKSKGIELLLNVFKSLEKIEAKLIIAGTGNGSYDEFLRKTYESSNVIFVGRVKQIDFFPKIDVLIAPSLWDEPLGMVVAEAFAFGKPVIGSRRGGISEMIDHGVNGYLFDPDNSAELIYYINSVMDSNHRKQLAGSARASSIDFLDVEKYARNYIEVYEEVISKKSKSFSLV